MSYDAGHWLSFRPVNAAALRRLVEDEGVGIIVGWMMGWDTAFSPGPPLPLALVTLPRCAKLCLHRRRRRRSGLGVGLGPAAAATAAVAVVGVLNLSKGLRKKWRGRDVCRNNEGWRKGGKKGKQRPQLGETTTLVDFDDSGR